MALAYIYQLAKFGDLISCSSKDVWKCTLSHVLIFIMTSYIWNIMGHGLVKNTKTWISWEWNITFIWNKKINLHVRWHISVSFSFVLKVSFNNRSNRHCSGVLLLTLNIFDMLFWCSIFCWLWTCKYDIYMEYFIALI